MLYIVKPYKRTELALCNCTCNGGNCNCKSTGGGDYGGSNTANCTSNTGN